MKIGNGRKLKMKKTAMFECIRTVSTSTPCPLHFYFVLPLRPLRLCGDIFKI